MEEEIIVIENDEEQEIVIIEDDIEYVKPTTQEKSVTPTKEEQIIVPDDGIFALSKVTIEGVTKDIDINIQPNNIKLGVNILGVEGNIEQDKPDQIKEATPTQEIQIITPDIGYELSQVNIKPIPSEYTKVEGTIEINSNGEYDVKQYEKANINVGETTIEKGVVINECDSNGYPTDISVVGMTSIPNYYFGNVSNSANGGFFSNLVNLKMPNEITKIGQYAFQSCIKLALTQLPDNLTNVGQYAFRYCSNLALTKLPDKLTQVETYAFQSCTNLALTELPDNLTYIYEGAFSSCTNLALTSLSKNLINISAYAFSSCTNLAITEIPSKVTTIGAYAFNSCTNITKLDILSELYTQLPNRCFYDCSKLAQLIIRKTTPPTINTTTFGNTPIAKGTGYIYVPDESIELYKSATNFSAYADQIKGVSELV